MIGGGGGGRGGGRDRFRREYSPRSSDDNNSHHHHHHHGRSNAPPSRNLWVGNLSHQLSESVLSEHFLRFGELESMAFQPGRSYAFINFRKEEDAIIAMKGLQGFVIAGLPLRIEFAKAEKSLASHDQHQQRRDEKRSSERRTSLFQRDSRPRPASPEPFYPEKTKMGDKNAEPSEVLWIGFPAFLNVDEMILRRAFSPFGEIEKVTVFPGRSYAFVQFRSVVAACRAKETLQGKLFDNPRVSICFAKSELGPPEHGRNSMNAPLSPHFKSYNHPGRQDRNFGNLAGDSHLESPHFASNLEASGVTGFGRKGSLWTGGSGSFEPLRFQGPRSELGPAEDVYEHQSSPARDRGPQIRNFSPGGFHRKDSLFEDPPDFVENDFHIREAKKLKTGPFPPDKELPEYPFYESGLEKQQTFPPRPFLDLPERDAYDKNFNSGPFSYKRTPDQPMNLVHLHGEREDHWKAPYDRFEAGSGSLPSNPVRWHTSPPKSHQSPLNDEWKWEGTIAKGGTPVCHARCFPVGKVMDIMLPEFLDCTARTGLDMLAKHFYQAANAWVVFFVPASDADIAFYNEFMHYLGEKQRAAVAKLGEKTTLFLVPPSEFSEKVLKVPGKMSISGVILKFQQPSSDFGPLNHPLEGVDSKIASFQEDVSHPKPITPDIRTSAWGPTQSFVNSFSEPIPPFSSFPPPRKPMPDDFPYMGNVPGAASSTSFSGSIQSTGASESLNESKYYLPPQHRNSALPSNWSPHHLQSLNHAAGNLLPHVPDNVGMQSSANTMAKEHPFGKPRVVQEASSSHYAPGVSDISLPGIGKFSQQEMKPRAFVSPPVPNLQPEQLAQLATLIGQRQQSGSGLVPQPSVVNQPEHALVPAQKSLSQSNASTESSASQLSQVQQLLQQTSNALAVVPQASSGEQQSMASGSQGNQAAQNIGASREDAEADPQKRLQATLQLAAALLQQIQQQAKTV